MNELVMGARILIVDDDAEHVQVASRILSRQGHIVRAATSARGALDLLASAPADVVVSDVDMPEMNGIDLLRAIKLRWSGQPVVMMSGLGSIEAAVEAVQEGAIDFVSKPFDFDRLRQAVSKALALVPQEPEFARPFLSIFPDPNLVGESPPMRSMKRLIKQIAPADCRVLIQGENGTGKELIANAIHAGSQRRDHPFVKVNCGALTSTLLESELFGHEKGSFTGATSRRQGRFEVAHRGTLLLDEVGELPLEAQVRLLRVIQEGEFERVGGSQTLRCDVRILAATNRDLSVMVHEGRFREDLYYRLNVVTLDAPALRERRSDIPLLVEHHLAQVDPQRRVTIADAAMELLTARTYPGNVRELQNLLERLCVFLPGGEVSPRELEEFAPPPRLEHQSEATVDPYCATYQQGVSYRDRLLQLERRLILEALDAHGMSKSSAAQALGTDKSFFYRKCRQFGID